jgi:hypothetical protein
VSVIIPAYNEQGRVGATAAAARTIAGVAEVVVVDDGSTDATADEAARAGAKVVRARHRGKGDALRRGIAAAAGELVLLLDADLGESAGAAEPLVAAVGEGRADLAIAVLPAPRRRPGLGIALGAARVGLWLLTGRWFAAPLSGQRCMTTELARTLPWARGFAAEVAASADAAALGARIAEVPLDLAHAPTGRNLAGFLHRGRQFAAVLAAFIPRALYPITPSARPAPGRRLLLAACAWIVLVALAALASPRLAAAVSVAAFAVGATACSLAVNHWAGVVRPNYRGREIPGAGGLAFALGPLAAAGAAAATADFRALPLAIVGLAAGIMAAVGLADDVFGARGVKGLFGHLRCLARGRLTTGGLKAITGGVIGLAVGWSMAYPSVPEALLNAALIAMSANLVNLLDLRPGRALKGFLLLALVAVAADGLAVYLVAPIGIIALAFAPLDLGGRAMMGDAGANALGIAAGIALAAALPLGGRLACVAVLAGIHLYSERHSLSDLIARVPALRRLDRLGRPGDEP